MRIVAGTAGGRQLKTPDNEAVRPTKDRVREAVFNSLGSHGQIEDQRFLDLFAGSGALGLEALSRGARACTFIDNDRRSVQVVLDNVDDLGFGEQAVVRQADGMAIVGNLGPHDVALLDPPYEFDQWPELLGIVPAQVVVIESDRPVRPGDGWRILKEKQYAGSVVVIAERVREDVDGLRARRGGGRQLMTRAMYPGSFDPVHIGHVDVVEAAAPLFDEVVVVAMYNPDKPTGFFDLTERQAMLEETFAHLPNVSTASAPGLVVTAAASLGVDCIIKGVRSAGDLEIEVQMAHTNKAVTGIQTLLVPSEPANSFVSSRFIREITVHGENVTALVPQPVAERLMRKVASADE